MSTRRFFLPVSLVWLTLQASGQIQVDKPVVLNGAQASDRQVLGLADPEQPSDAMTADALRTGAYRFATVTGTASWAITLAPTPSPLQAGAFLVLLSQDANAGPVELTVNGQGPFAVQADGDRPLQPNEIKAGAMITLYFNGTAFELTSDRHPVQRPCASGYVAVNERYCIETLQHDTAAFDAAILQCAASGGRLCTWGEWYTACAQAGPLGLSNMVGDYEWTNDAASADGYVRTVGKFSCNTGATGSAFGSPARNFRCCLRR